MSINTSTQLTAYNAAQAGYTAGVYQQRKSIANEISNDKQSYEHTQKQSNSRSEPHYSGKASAFSNSAQEIFHSMSGGFGNFHTSAFRSVFSGSFSSSETGLNQIDLKRHQNYFNQMMNFDNPSGSWVNVLA